MRFNGDGDAEFHEWKVNPPGPLIAAFRRHKLPDVKQGFPHHEQIELLRHQAPSMSTLAFCLASLLALGCISFFIRSTAWLLNRICRHCREALSAAGDDVTACDVDPTAQRLKCTVDTMRRKEASCAARYSKRVCSSDDFIRAKFLRIQAEIELLRHEAMPKSWIEACQDVHTRT
jgi:hypothetical protein